VIGVNRPAPSSGSLPGGMNLAAVPAAIKIVAVVGIAKPTPAQSSPPIPGPT